MCEEAVRVAEGQIAFDQRLDRFREAHRDLRRGLGRPVVDRAPRHAEPDAELGQRNRHATRQQARSRPRSMRA